MKIWCQLPVRLPLPQFQSFYDLNQRHYDQIKRSGTEITIKDVPTGLPPGSLAYLAFRQIHEGEILKSMLRAEQEGFDAVAGACFFDPGILAARSLMDIPVVGTAETSMCMARLIGNKFAVVTTNPRFVAVIEHQIEALNLRSDTITSRPVRALNDWDACRQASQSGNYDLMIDDFRAIAKACIQDGAEVLIAGCGEMAPMLYLNGIKVIDGVPVIDPVQVALKFAEMMVDIRVSGMPVKSHKGILSRPPEQDVANVYKTLGLS